jgi:hypothetical protein
MPVIKKNIIFVFHEACKYYTFSQFYLDHFCKRREIEAGNFCPKIPDGCGPEIRVSREKKTGRKIAKAGKSRNKNQDNGSTELDPKLRGRVLQYNLPGSRCYS